MNFENESRPEDERSSAHQFEPAIPEPIEHLIAGWDLPEKVELDLYTQLYDKLKSFPAHETAQARTYEIYLSSENPGGLHCFLLTVVAKVRLGVLLIIEMNLDYQSALDEPGR